MKKLFAWIKKLIKISAALSTNPKTKAKLEVAEKVFSGIEKEKNDGDK